MLDYTESLALIGIICVVLSFLLTTVLLVFTLINELLSSKLRRQLRCFSLGWMFVVTTASCAALVVDDGFLCIFIALAMLLGYAIIRILAIEIFATTNLGRERSYVRSFLNRTAPIVVSTNPPARQTALVKKRPRLKLRLNVRPIVIRNTRIHSPD